MDFIILFKLLKIILKYNSNDYNLNLLNNLFFKNKIFFIDDNMKFCFKEKSINNLINKKYIIIVKDDTILKINFNCHFHIITNKKIYNYENKNIITIGDNKADIIIPISKIFQKLKLVKVCNTIFPWKLNNNNNNYTNLIIDPLIFFLNNNHINNINPKFYKNKLYDNSYEEKKNINLYDFLKNNFYDFKIYNFFKIMFLKYINKIYDYDSNSNILKILFYKICKYRNLLIYNELFKPTYDLNYIKKYVNDYIFNNKSLILNLILNFNSNFSKFIKYSRFLKIYNNSKDGFEKLILIKKFFKNKNFIFYNKNNYYENYNNIHIIKNEDIYLNNNFKKKFHIHIISKNNKYIYPDFYNLIKINIKDFVLKKKYFFFNYFFIIKNNSDFVDQVIYFLKYSFYKIDNNRYYNFNFNNLIEKNVDYIKNVNNDNLIVIGYYTKNTLYSNEVIKLKVSLDNLKINYHIIAIKDFNDWNLNTYYKATFIKLMLEKYPNNKLLYVDSDAVLHSKPNIIYKLNFDIGISFIDNYLRSGTLFIKNTNYTLSVVNEWINLNIKILNDNLKKNNYSKYKKIQFEQMNLQIILEKYKYKNVFFLDDDYCIIDKDKPKNILIKPIIEHFQASRLYINKKKYFKDYNLNKFYKSNEIYIISKKTQNKFSNILIKFLDDKIIISNNNMFKNKIRIYYNDENINNSNNYINIMIIKYNKNLSFNNHYILNNNKYINLLNIHEYYFSNNYSIKKYFTKDPNYFFCYNNIDLAAIQYAIIKNYININLIDFDSNSELKELISNTKKKYKNINIKFINSKNFRLNNIKKKNNDSSNNIIKNNKILEKKQIIII